MLDSGTASERDLLRAQQEFANAKAEVERLREVYDIYRINTNSTYNIISPVSGFVVAKNISRNMLIRSDQGDELFTVSGLDDVWVMADVYEGDISKVLEEVDGQSMPRIPAHALIFDGGKQYVVCVSTDGYLRKQDVGVYKQTDKYCYLNAGLKEGDQVVNRSPSGRDEVQRSSRSLSRFRSR